MMGLKIIFFVLWNSCSLHCKKLAFLISIPRFILKHDSYWSDIFFFYFYIHISYFIKTFFLASDFLASDSIVVAIVFYLSLKTANIGFNCCVRLSLSSKFMSQLCNSQVFAVSIFLKFIWYWIGLCRGKGWWHSE